MADTKALLTRAFHDGFEDTASLFEHLDRVSELAPTMSHAELRQVAAELQEAVEAVIDARRHTEQQLTKLRQQKAANKGYGSLRNPKHSQKVRKIA